MIKCISFGKSLKQLLFTLLISCFILLGNSFVSAVGYYGTVSTDYSVSNYNSNYNLTVSNHGNFFSQYLGGTKILFMPGKGNFIYWSDSGVPYIYYSSYINEYDGGYTSSYQGLAIKYFVCNNLSSFSSLQDLNCDYYNIVSDSVNTFSNYLRNYNLGDYYFYYWGSPWINSQSYYEFLFCFTESLTGNNSLCFGNSTNPYSNFYHGISLTGDLFDSNRNNVSFDSISSSLLKLSPYRSNSNNNNTNVDYNDSMDGVNYNTFTGSDLIDYYESNPTLEFDESICYVGTNDLTSLYEDGIPYFEGQGKTIFELYSHLYGQNSNTPLNEIGKFMNAWWINYATWFEGRNRNTVDNSVVYNANYSPSSGFYLTYNNLTNPFVGNLSAVYFMASNITSYTPTLESQGDEVALYCYYKLGTENNSWITEGDDFQAYWNNVGKFTVQKRRNNGYFSGADSIVSQSRNGTPLDYFTGDDNLEFNTFFSQSFDRFKSVFSSFDYSDFSAVGVLPTYIILFLLAIILFRFLQH